MFENYPLDVTLAGRAGGAGIRPVRVMERTNFPLTVMAFPGRTLRLRVIYDTPLRRRVGRPYLLGHMGFLLDAMAADPDRSVGTLPIASAEELHKALGQWNELPTEPDLPRPGAREHDPVLDHLSDEDVEALIGDYLGRDEDCDD